MDYMVKTVKKASCWKQKRTFCFHFYNGNRRSLCQSLRIKS